MARRKSADKNTAARRVAHSRSRIPSAQTLFRLMSLDRDAGESVRKTVMKLNPLLMLRDGRRVKSIRLAASPEELLDLLPTATGLADFAWQERMRELGAAALPAISDRLRRIKEVHAGELRDMMAEKLIAALRWHGADGARVLLACFDALDDYAKSLACLALGVLGCHAGADRLWAFYQHTATARRESYLVGPLWGLVDLGDSRAAEALADLVRRKQDFYELYGLLARAGDARTVWPLLQIIDLLPDSQRVDSTMALIAIAHRIGRDALIDALAQGGDSEADRVSAAEIADVILAKPADGPQKYFEMFYAGFTAETLAKAMPMPVGKS